MNFIDSESISTVTWKLTLFDQVSIFTDTSSIGIPILVVSVKIMYLVNFEKYFE